MGEQKEVVEEKIEGSDASGNLVLEEKKVETTPVQQEIIEEKKEGPRVNDQEAVNEKKTDLPVQQTGSLISAEENENLSQDNQIAVFKVDNEEFGVNLVDILEIIKLEGITKVPNTEDYVKGVINLRGKIVVVVDLAKKLGLKEKEYDEDTLIIIVEKDNTIMGMIVDSVTEVMMIPSRNIKPAPQIVLKKIKHIYIDDVAVFDNRLIILLNLGELVNDENEPNEIEQI